MHATTALTLVQCVFFPAIGIGDAQIIQANDAAADVYGVASASELVGTWASDWQPKRSNDARRTRWALRKEHQEIAQDYASLVRRPDGEIVGCLGTLVSNMVGIEGHDTYLTWLEVVKELDEPPIPDLNAYGITMEQARIHTGSFTVADIRHMYTIGTLSDTMHGETFTSIIRTCELLSTENCGWTAGHGIDFALCSGVAWTLHDGEKNPVRVAQACARCNYTWWARRPKSGAQCPSCKGKQTSISAASQMGKHHHRGQ